MMTSFKTTLDDLTKVLERNNIPTQDVDFVISIFDELDLEQIHKAAQLMESPEDQKASAYAEIELQIKEMKLYP